MAFVIVWRYEIDDDRRAAFEEAYGPHGPWHELFGRAPGFAGTELVRGDDGAYLTVDRWSDRGAHARFLAEHGAEYEALDRRLAPLTASETWVGAGDVV